jgi:hypothetical protein
MVTEDAQTPFSVISLQAKQPDGLHVYKLFSTVVLDQATLEQIFSSLTLLDQRYAPRIVPFAYLALQCVRVFCASARCIIAACEDGERCRSS